MMKNNQASQIAIEKIIVLYSHENEAYKLHLERHLKILKSYGIKFWNDLEKTIPEFKEADVIIIILSSYFIASDLIQDTVIPKVFKQITSKSKLFPIVVEPCPIKLITWLTSKNVMAYDNFALSKKTEKDQDEFFAMFVERIGLGLIEKKKSKTRYFEYNQPSQILIDTHHFEDFRKNNFIYVDKTKFVYQLLNNNMSQCFLSRPRRFGKSLLITMMKELFSANKELFKGLYVYDKYDFKPYPVIHLPFTSLDYDITLPTEISIYKALTNYFAQIAEEKQVPSPEGPYLGKLVKNLYKKYQAPVVILIDEYDKPLLRFIKDAEKRNKVRSCLRDVFSSLKDLTNIIKFLFITGVSKFTKVSIFSDLNNLTDLTMLSDYSQIAGFTQQELEHYFKNFIILLAKKEGKTKEEILEQVKLWYNGYSWDGKSFVYTPFSISKLFKHMEFKNYWFSSATPTFLIDVIDELKNGKVDFRDFESYHMFNDDFEKYEIENIRLLPFLFQSGYLSVYNVEQDNIKIRFPNKEVRTSFFQYLFEEFSMINPKNFNKLFHAIHKSDINEIIKVLKSILATIPYQILEKKEKVYHSHVYTILKTIHENTYSEVSTNLGRIDTLMETQNAVFIFEFKMKSAEQGIKQIKAKKYADGFFNKGKKIFLIGVKFSDTDRNIDEFKYEVAVA